MNDVDVLHGVEVRDPYRWLEDGDSDATTEWVAQQNASTRLALDALPNRSQLHARQTELLQAGASSAPIVAGDRVFTLDRWGELDQAVLVVRSANERQPAQTLIDPHQLLGDETAAVDWYQPSRDGRLLAYGVSTSGDERSTLGVLDVDTKTPLPDTIEETRAASVAWAPDGSGFAYTRYPPDEEYWRKVWWHDLGTDPADDPLVFGDLPDKTAWPYVRLSRDGRWLLVHVSLGWSRIDVHLLDRTTSEWTEVITEVEAISDFRVIDDELIGFTTLDADRGRLVTAPLGRPEPSAWQTIVPESERVLDGYTQAGSSLLVSSTITAVSAIDRYELDGSHVEQLALPALGAAMVAGHQDRQLGFVTFTSFTQPETLLRWTPNGLEPWSDLESPLDPGDYVVEQVRYESTDGTAVPMFLVRGAGTDPSPDTPTVLTGYGGFGITNAPAYSPLAVQVCDDGGVFALANIRGGSEEGEAWHRAGMRENKQQSFDDFIAAADCLVAEGRTSRSRLAIRGGSNGGLLVGAALTQRPDLCAAVHCAVPLLDMVRYHLFLIARLWIPEYGDPDVAEEFDWLHAYSPYHRVVDGTRYPATLITTAESDSRVDPFHARKMTARLQEATAGGDERPILLRLETRAGHGQGKPVSKQADELTDVISFLRWHLGVAG